MIIDECNFDIMSVCETFIDSNVADNEISIDGYSIAKKDRNRHDGGVLRNYCTLKMVLIIRKSLN